MKLITKTFLLLSVFLQSNGVHAAPTTILDALLDHGFTIRMDVSKYTPCCPFTGEIGRSSYNYSLTLKGEPILIGGGEMGYIEFQEKLAEYIATIGKDPSKIGMTPEEWDAAEKNPSIFQNSLALLRENHHLLPVNGSIEIKEIIRLNMIIVRIEYPGEETPELRLPPTFYQGLKMGVEAQHMLQARLAILPARADKPEGLCCIIQ